MIFKKLLSVVGVSLIITSSSFKLNSYRARAANTEVSEIVRNQHISTRQKIFNETGVNIPDKVPREHVKLIYSESKKQKIPLKILVKVIQRESEFDSKAYNKRTGAKGYMGLMPSTYNQYSRKLKLEKNPTNNIKIGSLILKEMYDLWDKDHYSEKRKWKLALASYNAGYDKVNRIKNVPNIHETKSFIKFILE